MASFDLGSQIGEKLGLISSWQGRLLRCAYGINVSKADDCCKTIGVCPSEKQLGQISSGHRRSCQYSSWG
jgi:hypothetical protein